MYFAAECRFCGVEPVCKDFLAGEIPSCVTYPMEWQRRMNQPQRAMSATGGA